MLTTWACFSCQARNLEAMPHCGVCHVPRPAPSMFRQAIAARRRRALPPQDLEDFCRRHHAKTATRHRAEVHLLNDEIFLTLTPEEGDPCVFRVDENDLTPCDGDGRASW